jgi:hypothetical protein
MFMAEEISAEQLETAEQYLVSLKESGEDPGSVAIAMQSLTDLRSAYRRQEEGAGRRVGLVGGDASTD